MHIEHSEFQDQLLRGLTHKMNNILSLFQGYIGLLLDDKKLDPATLNGLNRIKEGAGAASELMDRMSALARPSSLIWREINLCAFLHTMKPSFLSYLRPKATLKIECDDEMPHIWADTSHLRVATLEIVRNACEASPASGEITITAAAESPVPHGISSAAQPITWLSITVTDHGPGIPPNLKERVFNPFFTTKGKQNAAGLGLTVALGLVQRMGGVIRIDSKPGNTSVRLLLPSRSETM